MKTIFTILCLLTIMASARAALVATNSITLQSVATTTVIGLTNTIANVALPQRTYRPQARMR